MTIATTHVGSLPRGPQLTPLLLDRDHGEPYDAEEFDRVVQAAVDDAVARQVEAGVTIVSDGELGKVGYSTYMIERLSGFGGHTDRKPALDLAPLPDLRAKLAHIMGSQEFTRASCIGQAHDPSAADRRHPPLPLGPEQARQRHARLHERGIARPDHRFPEERLLP
jgi:5-methyltetrahydropteroyltriglutamate--homocysteine methyltransferase